MIFEEEKRMEIFCLPNLGDGFRITKSLHYLHMCATILNVKKGVLSPERQHTLLMFEGDEDYQLIKVA